MDTRSTKVLIGSAGGTASKKSNNYKISLPSSWMKEIGITTDQRNVIMYFDGETISITKSYAFEEFAEKKKQKGHKVKKFDFFDNEKLCTVFYADFTDKTVAFRNYTDNTVKTAFGKRDIVTWSNFLDFLEERCVPCTRAGIREYLETLDIDEYDTLRIIKKTNGRMAEDSQWLKVSDL